jgi:hypothetical protein
VALTAQDWVTEGVGEVWVGCSGNFTVERVLAAATPTLASHGNDVTFYSVVLGRWLSGEPLEVSLRPEWLERHRWLDYGQDGSPEAEVARMLLLSQHALYLSKDGRYYRRVAEGIERQWPHVFDKTVGKVRAVQMRVESFWAGDVTDWIDSVVPHDAAVMLYPPFYAGDYEAMFAALESAYLWTPPLFAPLTEQRRDQMLEQVADRARWLVGVPHPWESHEVHLRGVTQTTNRGESIYLYGRSRPRMVVVPRQKIERVPAPRLTAGDVLGKRLWLAPLTEAQFASLRSQYMNAGIRPGQPDLPIAVMCDEVLVGAFAYQRPRLYLDPRCAYLLSDFPTGGSDYRHLAKLVLVGALSSEARVLVQRMANGPIDSVATTAFTDRPTSAKYGRGGFFRLSSRKPDPTGDHQFMLQYESALPRWSLAEGYERWQSRHSERIEREGHARAG